MIKKMLIVILLILSLIISVPAYAQTQGLTVSGVSFGPSSSPIEVEAGSYNVPLFVYLTAWSQVINVSVYASSTSQFMVISEPQNISVIPPGSTMPSIAYINVSNRAVNGVYAMQILVKYIQIEGTSYVAKNFTYVAELPITSFSSVQVYSAYWGTGTTLGYPGAVDLPLTLIIRNAGSNTAYNATLSINVQQPFTSASGNSTVMQFIGPLPAGSSVPIEVYLNINSSAKLGYYPINITLNWNSGIMSVQRVYVPVFGSPEVEIQGYSLNPPQLFPGTQDAELYISFVNSGNVTASNVAVNISTVSPLGLISSSSSNIGELPPGTPVQLMYLVSVSNNASSPSTAFVNVNIMYAGKHVETTISVPISPKASLSVNPSSVAITQGDSDFNVYYTVHNYGNTTAKNVQAQLILPNTISGNTFDYLGDIPAGSSAIATFSLDVGSNAPTGTYRATVEISWQQDNAPSQEFTSRIPITYTIQQSFVNHVFGYILTPPAVYLTILLIIVVIVAIIAVLVVSRRRSSQ
ncbi:MAG: NEW3 domain-containing protein [Conexivisphaerales archaeon]